MTIPYVQLLPTVFVRADVFPNLQAFQATQKGLKNVYDPAPGLSAAGWDDEPTRPDIPIPNFGTPPALPPDIERALADRYEMAPAEMRRFKGWMEARSLRVRHFTKAVDYLGRMRRDAFEEAFENEPTARIDIRDLDRRRREARQGFAEQADL
jgi:hypothetical protein